MITHAERGSVLRPALSRLITASTEEFADEYWSEKPLLSRAADLGESFSDLFSLDAVDELVANRGIRTPFVRMANEGSVLKPERYTGSGGFGAEISDQLDSAKVLEEFAAGSTLVLQALHRTWQPLAEFTRQLVADLGHPAQVNAYVTPASSRGFDPHYDVHDVFVIQIYGEKHWSIHPPVQPNPLRSQPWSDYADAVARQAVGPAAIDETFRPGDVLYLPRGWIHSATALGGISVHLTIGVAALTRWDVVQQLVSRAAADSGLRESLPLGMDLGDPDALDRIIGEASGRLVDALSTSDPAAVGRSLARTLAKAERPEPVAPMATVKALALIDHSTPVSWRRGLGARVEHTMEDVRVVLTDRTVTLPVEAADAITALSRGESTMAGALEGLDPASSIVVVRRLVREGILVIR